MVKEIKTNVIRVKNADVDPDTTATLLIQNKIDYIPKVSVIIPVYNVEKYLRECLDSVINQTLKEIEIICVDDGSTDGSLKILEKYAKKDSRIKIISQQNAGLSAARNTGLKHVNSEYVYFIDSDDYISNDAIETLYTNLIESNSDVSIGGVHIFGDVNKIDMENSQKWFDRFVSNVGKHNMPLDIRANICPTAWNKLYKMSIINAYNLEFPVGLINEDEYWLWAYMVHCKNYVISDKETYFYLQRKTSIMGQRFVNEKALDLIDIHKRLIEMFKNNGIKDKYEDIIGKWFKIHVDTIVSKLPLELYSVALEKINSYIKDNNKLADFLQEMSTKLSVKIIGNKNIKQTPKVSVIIPVYNVEKYLRECLDSVINQTLKEIEIICIDDGSTDNSLEILKEYAKKDSRIQILTQVNQRQGVARNNGIKLAKGEYIFFADSDDWLHKDCLLTLYNKSVSEKSDLCIGGILTFDQQSKKIEIKDFRDTSAYSNRKCSPCKYTDIKKAVFSHFYPFPKLYNREFILNNNILFAEKNYFEDVIFAIKTVVLAQRISIDDNNYYYYRVNIGSSTMDIGKTTNKVFDILTVLQSVKDFLYNNASWDVLTQEYCDFVFSQISMYAKNLSDDLKLKFYDKSVEFIQKNTLNNKSKKLLDFCNQHSKSFLKKALLVEVNDFHGECLPGYAKYLLDMGYCVDILMNRNLEQESPTAMFLNNPMVTTKYLSITEIFDFINSKHADDYEVCLLNSDVLWINNTWKTFLDFIDTNRIKAKILCVEHRLEYLPALTRNVTALVLKKFYKFRNTFEVNPHYFGEYQKHHKNKIVNFVVAGNIQQTRKNYNLLFDAVTELANKNISNFKITVIGRGSLGNLPEKIRKFFDIKGRVSYPDLYKYISEADFFATLLDPEFKEHDRYLTTGTSGSFQLIYGLNIPCLIAKKFAECHHFSKDNSIVYQKNSDLATAMIKCINMSDKEYKEIKSNLQKTADGIYKSSLYNLQRAIDEKTKKCSDIKPYLLFPYYGFANLWMKVVSIPFAKFVRHTKRVLYSHSKRGIKNILNSKIEELSNVLNNQQQNYNSKIEELYDVMNVQKKEFDFKIRNLKNIYTEIITSVIDDKNLKNNLYNQLALTNNNDIAVKKELQQLGKFYYLPNKGNLGDVLIAFSTYQFFDANSFDYEVFDMTNVSSYTKKFNFVYGGGGIWNAFYKQDYQEILEVFKNPLLEQCIILPSSFYDCKDVLEVLDERFIVFCREEQSYKYCKSLNKKARFLLAPDMVINANFECFYGEIYNRENLHNFLSDEDIVANLLTIIFQRYKSVYDKLIEKLKSIKNKKVAYMIRGDKEGINKGLLSDIDLSDFGGGYCSDKSYDFIQSLLFVYAINMFDVIVTDRLHIAICAAKLNKHVILLDNSYKKNSSVYNYSLKSFKNVHLVAPQEVKVLVSKLSNKKTVKQEIKVPSTFIDFISVYGSIKNTYGIEKRFWS